MHLKRTCILLLWNERLYIYSVKSISSRALFNATLSLLIFCLEDLSIFDSGGLKSPTITVAVYIFLEVLQDFLYVFGCCYVGSIYIYNVYVFLMDFSLEYYEVSFCVSFYDFCFEVLFCLM